MKRLFCLILLLTLSGPIVAQEPDAEIKRLAGTWRGASGVWRGNALSAAQARDCVLVLRLPRPANDLGGGARGLDLVVPDKLVGFDIWTSTDKKETQYTKEWRDYGYTLDASKTPAVITTLKIIGIKGHGFQGIYRTEADTLTLCLQLDRTGPLPKEFKSQRNTDVLLLTFKRDGPAKGDPKPAKKPGPNRADEPIAKKMSLERARDFLDGAANAWHEGRKCASCHTTYPYVIAGASMGGDRATLKQLVKFLTERVDQWDEGGNNMGLLDGTEGVSEVVAIAATLSMVDANGTGKLQRATRKALERMWTMQSKDGSWTWNKHELPPQEYDDYYGAVYAAIGLGAAPEKYAQSDAAKPGIAKLQTYLRNNPPPNLHHKVMLLWASLRLDGLMSAEDRAKTVKELKALQRKDGGWNLPSLGDWKRLDGTANDKDAPSDGYATGLAIYVLRQAGVDKKDETVERGIAWLRANQRESGRWFTRSINADRAHYNTVAGTAYAIMALKACDIE